MSPDILVGGEASDVDINVKDTQMEEKSWRIKNYEMFLSLRCFRLRSDLHREWPPVWPGWSLPGRRSPALGRETSGESRGREGTARS